MEHSHSHDYLAVNEKGERRAGIVLILTTITMVVEIIAGNLLGSMALLADGWHMATHVAAFLITLFAYRYARRHASNPAFSFGTGKVGVLGGFSSAVALAVVAVFMAMESGFRLIEPRAIYFNEAIAVAVVGLVVNLLSAVLLHDHHGGHSHGHDEHHSHGHSQGHGGHEDHNLKAAYFHVLADALTSVLAIVALSIGKYTGWIWLDAAMGIVGAIIIGRWSWGLVKDTAPILMDKHYDGALKEEIIERLEEKDTRVFDFHLWRITPNHLALIVGVQAAEPRSPAYYKDLIGEIDGVVHVTVETVHE